MFLFCIFTTYATYINSTDVKAPIFVGLASIWFLYKMMKNKEPPAMSTPDLASYERNEKFCPEHKPTKAELDAIARDEAEDEAENKEAKKNSFISQIIAFWISVWTWLPKTIYNLWLKVYDSLFGPDKPCPAGGEPQEPEPEPEPEPESQPVSQSAEAAVINTPAIQQVVVPPTPPPNTLNESQPVVQAETSPSTEQPQPLQPEINKPILGGGRKHDLLRKIKNLTRTLKSRSK
jgi:hypothetical protein